MPRSLWRETGKQAKCFAKCSRPVHFVAASCALNLGKIAKACVATNKGLWENVIDFYSTRAIIAGFHALSLTLFCSGTHTYQKKRKIRRSNDHLIVQPHNKRFRRGTEESTTNYKALRKQTSRLGQQLVHLVLITLQCSEQPPFRLVDNKLPCVAVLGQCVLKV